MGRLQVPTHRVAVLTFQRCPVDTALTAEPEIQVLLRYH